MIRVVQLAGNVRSLEGESGIGLIYQMGRTGAIRPPVARAGGRDPTPGCPRGRAHTRLPTPAGAARPRLPAPAPSAAPAPPDRALRPRDRRLGLVLVLSAGGRVLVGELGKARWVARGAGDQLVGGLALAARQRARPHPEVHRLRVVGDDRKRRLLGLDGVAAREAQADARRIEQAKDLLVL